MDGNNAIVSYQFFTTPNDIKLGILFKSSLEGNNGNVCGIRGAKPGGDRQFIGFFVVNVLID